MQRLEADKINKGIDFCHIVKLFGYCTKTNCPKRHNLSKQLDVSNFLPKCGRIRFKIVQMIDLTHYFIQLIDHVDDNNKKTVFDIRNVAEKLSDLLRNKKNDITDLVVGAYYAYKNDEIDLYHRCRLLKYNDNNCEIILIDEGNFINCDKSKLCNLPNEFTTEYYAQQGEGNNFFYASSIIMLEVLPSNAHDILRCPNNTHKLLNTKNYFNQIYFVSFKIIAITRSALISALQPVFETVFGTGSRQNSTRSLKGIPLQSPCRTFFYCFCALEKFSRRAAFSV